MIKTESYKCIYNRSIYATQFFTITKNKGVFKNERHINEYTNNS